MIKPKKYFLYAIYVLGSIIGCQTNSGIQPGGFVQVQPLEMREKLEPIKIVGRSNWTNVAPNFFDIDPMTTPYRITIHHTDISIDSTSQRDEKIGLLRILDIHKNKKGWADIGYHYLIGPSGTIYEGRNMRYQGAHAKGDNNIGNIGIAVMGDYETNFPPKTQIDSLKKLTRYCQKKYKISGNQIFGHIHFTGTKCPGKNMMNVVKELQNSN